MVALNYYKMQNYEILDYFFPDIWLGEIGILMSLFTDKIVFASFKIHNSNMMRICLTLCSQLGMQINTQCCN